MKNNRTQSSIKNSIFGLLSQFINICVSFLSRTVFIYTLGKIYLGFNGLFNDMLTVLSLAELGVGTAVAYSLYKPVAEGNEGNIIKLVNFYRKLYLLIGTVIIILGLSLIPFLSYFVNGIPANINITEIYIYYLLNTVISYFLGYRAILLNAYQYNYISSIVNTSISVLTAISQIFVLIVTKNFYVYLGIQVIFTLVNNLIIYFIVGKKYSYIKKCKGTTLDKEEKKDIFINIRALFYSRLSSVIVTSTDNILISIFVSTIKLGLYSNYVLFVNIIRNVLNTIFSSITGSIGNLIATSDKEKIYKVFKNIWFLNYWFIAFSSSFLFVLINPFIEIWLGRNYVLEPIIVLFICINLFMRLIRNTFLTFNDAFGNFIQLRDKSIIEAMLNLFSSLLYLKVFDLGILGVLLGTFTSNILTNWWIEPLVLFRKLDVKWHEYFIYFMKYFLVFLLNICISSLITNTMFFENSLISFIFRVIVSFIIINLIIVFFFFKTPEFANAVNLFEKEIRVPFKK